MANIGLITEKSRVNEMIDEDQRLAAALKRLGANVFSVAWDDFDSWAFQKLDLALFRTPWNYHREISRFQTWLKAIQDLDVLVLNSPATVHWNINKTYLRELSDRGVAIVPTHFFEMQKFKFDMSWPESATGNYVLKPSISASAARTFRGDRIFLTDILTEENIYSPGETLLLQPFVESVLDKGEWGFVFFNGEFSHAIHKKPKQNDFRVQIEHGGEWQITNPIPKIVREAQKVLEVASKELLYARVDMIEIDGRLHLMELEVIEPMLLLQTDALAENFARAIMSRVVTIPRPRLAVGEFAQPARG